MSKKNDLVIDPYAGVGTTLLAAVKNNRLSKGSDIMKKYTDIAKKRFKLLIKENFPTEIEIKQFKS